MLYYEHEVNIATSVNPFLPSLCPSGPERGQAVFSYRIMSLFANFKFSLANTGKCCQISFEIVIPNNDIHHFNKKLFCLGHL